MVTHHDLLAIHIQPSPFSSPTSSLFKITSMMAGDFSFNTILGFESDGMISFPIISYILWILFLIVMPILFINTLVSEVNYIPYPIHLWPLRFIQHSSASAMCCDMTMRHATSNTILANIAYYNTSIIFIVV